MEISLDLRLSLVVKNSDNGFYFLNLFSSPDFSAIRVLSYQESQRRIIEPDKWLDLFQIDNKHAIYQEINCVNP